MNFSENLDKFVERGAVEELSQYCIAPGSPHWLAGLRDYKSGAASLKPIVLKLYDAAVKENPKWKTCDHDYEPNTTMDYFRCDKCGIRPKMAEALAEVEQIIGGGK